MLARCRTPGPLDAGPHRLEFVDAKRNRRLEFIVTRAQVTVIFGRSDGACEQTTQSFPDLQSALDHVARRQKPVLARGYVVSGRNAQLEAAIARNPDDPAGYLVYADWLAARGDPLGELINVATALDERPNDVPLASRERELLAAYPLSVADPRWRSWPLTYRLGFVEGWHSHLEVETAMKVGDVRDLDTLQMEPPSFAWLLREQLAAIRRHRCGIFMRRVYTQRRSYGVRRENDRWVLERIA